MGAAGLWIANGRLTRPTTVSIQGRMRKKLGKPENRWDGDREGRERAAGAGTGGIFWQYGFEARLQM